MDEQNNQTMPNQGKQNVAVNLVLGILSIVAGICGLLISIVMPAMNVWSFIPSAILVSLIPVIIGFILSIIGNINKFPQSKVTRVLLIIGFILNAFLMLGYFFLLIKYESFNSKIEPKISW